MSDSWQDFENLRHSIKTHTVDRLKQILAGLNEECGTHFSKSGKKQDIIDRIVQSLDSWRAATATDKWTKARAVLYQVRNSGSYTPSRMPGSAAVYNPTNTVVKTASFVSIPPPVTAKFDPYAAPRKTPANAPPTPSKLPPLPRPSIHFKESPFMHGEQLVSAIVECPESTSATDRRQQSVVFTLNAEQTTKLRNTGSKNQLRLFCTSSTFYSPNPTFRTTNVPCLIEFPPTCEVRVNGSQVTANLKGLKKKPGTAPPPDIGKFVRHSGQNRIEMVYVNSQQPAPAKKFYLVVMLVETTSVDQLVKRLKETSFKPAEDIRRLMAQSAAVDDDDIISGPQKMSLKCPLSFMRIAAPCRSSLCVHPHCFDASSWFYVMEQTTTWLCPVCEKSLDSKDLIIDGYFNTILQATPDDVEDVMVEADGEWHTADNAYGSTAWKVAHKPVTQPAQTPPRQLAAPISPARQDTNHNAEIFILDSDDEEDRVKRELSPSYGSSSASLSHSHSQYSSATSVPPSQSEAVIDLTLDSEDEESTPPPPAHRTSNGKRTADDALLTTPSSDNLWKKTRVDLPDPRPSSSFNTIRASLPSLNSLPIRLPPPVPSNSSRYPQSSNTLPPLAAFFPGTNPGRSQPPPPTSPPYSSTRVNGASGSHWS